MPKSELAPLIDTEVFNLPDIAFAAWCLEQYGVNRGVYNTIDQWFFQQGYRQIVLRRKQIIAFLQQVPQTKPNKAETGRIKLGKGMLIPALLAYVQNGALAHSR